MTTWGKVTLSILGTFLGGVTASYTANPAAPARSWLMAGLVPVAAYLVGYAQLNPALAARRKPPRPPVVIPPPPGPRPAE